MRQAFATAFLEMLMSMEDGKENKPNWKEAVVQLILILAAVVTIAAGLANIFGWI